MSKYQPSSQSNGHVTHSPSANIPDETSVAGPSSGGEDYTKVPYTRSHNEQIVDHLYNAGFQMGEYADTLVHVHQNTYRLHAIILSRSPYLAHLMSTSPKSSGMHSIHIPLENIPEISDEGIAIALGYLYSSVSLNALNPGNARAVLAAGCLLGGMDDFCHYAYQACRNSITVETINDWIDFVDHIAPTTDGAATPMQRASVLGPYALQLRNDVFQFLVVTLPDILEVHTPPADSQVHNGFSSGRETLLQIFSRVPFDLFKSAMETPAFRVGPSGSDQERFKFAKAAIELRKRTGGGHGADETVVLAFGGGNSGSAVHVTRKMRKRALFKVG